MLYECQCVLCGLIYDVDYEADVKTFKCDYCAPDSVRQPIRPQKMLNHSKLEKYAQLERI